MRTADVRMKRNAICRKVAAKVAAGDRCIGRTFCVFLFVNVLVLSIVDEFAVEIFEIIEKCDWSMVPSLFLGQFWFQAKSWKW